MTGMSEGFRFGRTMKYETDCCTKPVGCGNPTPTCQFLNHPAKRARRGDTTVRCQAECVRESDNVHLQCRLLNGHDGDHEPVAR